MEYIRLGWIVGVPELTQAYINSSEKIIA